MAIEKGADIHTDNDAALRYASESGHLDIVKYLVKNGANINAALVWASNLVIFHFLIENGADWRILSNPTIKKLLKIESESLLKTLTTNYLSLKNITPKITIDNELKEVIPKQILLKMIYETPYIEFCPSIKLDLKKRNIPPLRLIALANLMKLEFDMDISWINLCDKIKYVIFNALKIIIIFL